MLSVASRVRSRLRRRRRVPVMVFDGGHWRPAEASKACDRRELTLATFNIWNDPYFAEQRYAAIADLTARHTPDVMVFQEVTPQARDIVLSHPWIRRHCYSAAVTGRGVDDYGMLMVSRVPLRRVTYTPLPSPTFRGFLHAEVGDAGAVVCSVHLDSGKASADLRSRQLRRVFHALRTVDDAVVLGDFNMRDSENHRIVPPFTDVWPTLRPRDPGFTEDTSINLMRLDARNKHRQARFDRVLLKGSAWAAVDIGLLGTEPLSCDHDRVFPSDHFGVRCVVRRTTESA